MIKRILANLAQKYGNLLGSFIKSKVFSINCPLCQSKLICVNSVYLWSCPKCPQILEFEKSYFIDEIYAIKISPQPSGPQGRVWLNEKIIHIWDTSWIKSDIKISIPYTGQSAQELIDLVNRIVKLKAFL